MTACPALRPSTVALLAALLCCLQAGCSKESATAPQATEPMPAAAATAGPPTAAPIASAADADPVSDTSNTVATNAAPIARPPAGQGSGWTYDTQAAERGTVQSASIRSNSGSETLVFEQHPVTGRRALLTFSDPLACDAGCKVALTVDGAAPEQVRVTRPFDENARVTLRNPRELWNTLAGANTLVIAYPSASGTTEASFDVSGLDPDRLPGWAR